MGQGTDVTSSLPFLVGVYIWDHPLDTGAPVAPFGNSYLTLFRTL